MWIWSHQINRRFKQKIIYGRGSPDTNFTPLAATLDTYNTFEGALPTTIYGDFSEVFANNPDIDSTALMISTTAWILCRLLSDNKNCNGIVANNDIDQIRHIGSNLYVANTNATNIICSEENFLSKVTNHVVPSMLNAVDYLANRDIDDDGLVEQEYNEDWMDTALRCGNIVYSFQWTLALKNFSNLLFHLQMLQGNHEMKKLAARAISSVEQRLWSDRDGCYFDIIHKDELQNSRNVLDNDTMIKRILTQDISLYLVAITEEDIAYSHDDSSCMCNNKNSLPYNNKQSPSEQNENKNENTCYHLTKSYNHGVKSTFDTLQGRRRKMDGLL